MLKYDCEYDAVVIGLGTGGAIAALVMAESGLKVCGVEKLNMLGGSATAGGIIGYYYDLPGGRFEQLDVEANELRKDFCEGGRFHMDAKGMTLERKLQEKNVDIFWESALLEVIVEGQKVVGVVINTPQGIRRIGCKYLLDGSGNGDACALAGAEFRLGRESDDKCQPYSSVRVFRRGVGVGIANFDAGYIKCHDAADFTRGIIHSNALHVRELDQSQDDLFYITQLPGLREGRLVVCDESLTFKSFIDGEYTTNKVLGYAYSNFDSHSQDWALLDQDTRDWMVVSSMWGKVVTVPITLEMLTVRNFENLLVVCRALSVDHLTASLLRMERAMQKIGEIAGLAVTAAVQENIPVRSVNRDGLAEKLLASGCLNQNDIPDCSFQADPEVLKSMLDSEKGGEALWYMGRHYAQFRETLLAMLKSESRFASVHSALALGLAGDAAGLPVLRQLVKERCDYQPLTSRSHNQRWILAAIDLLGRFGKIEDVELLLGVLNEINDDIQINSHLVRSLLELGDKLPECRKQIRENIDSVLHNPKFNDKLLLKNSSNTKSQVFERLGGSLETLAGKHYKLWNEI